jgi:4-phosphopantoate---beta-alanine ligase
MTHDIPESHPRRESLRLRERLAEGLEKNITAKAGMFAHGRGEAFDYIIGETTTPPAQRAICAAAAYLIQAARPVLSVNGNTAALCPGETVALGDLIPAALEVNLFYQRSEREQAIADWLRAHGAAAVLGVGADASRTVPGLTSARAKVDPRGIYGADVVFLALEDGDRTEWLVKMGKKVIAVDLNPFSRTAQYAHVTIVDNIPRALPRLIEEIGILREKSPRDLSKIIKSYDNKKTLREAIRLIRLRLDRLAKQGVFLRIPGEDGGR